ncbi:unnamed protein product [Rhizophagus irregularis]|nr:unnamed protein product [Rhizophagus irregularis]
MNLDILDDQGNSQPQSQPSQETEFGILFLVGRRFGILSCRTTLWDSLSCRMTLRDSLSCRTTPSGFFFFFCRSVFGILLSGQSFFQHRNPGQSSFQHRNPGRSVLFLVSPLFNARFQVPVLSALRP